MVNNQCFVNMNKLCDDSFRKGINKRMTNPMKLKETLLLKLQQASLVMWWEEFNES